MSDRDARRLQTIVPVDCGVLVLGNDDVILTLLEELNKNAEFTILPLCRASSDHPSPWLVNPIATFLSERDWRQLIVIGDVTDPIVASACIYALEEGFILFVLDPHEGDMTSERTTSLIRLSQSGAVPITQKQLISDITFMKQQ